MDTLADDAAALIENLGLDPCHFAGNSMGGFVAARLAARRPDLLRSAVMMGSSAEGEDKVAEFGPLVTHMQQHGTKDVIDALMYILFGDATLTNPEKEGMREHWRRYMLELPKEIGDAAHGVVYRKGVLGELAGAEVPILAIAGEEDHAYPPEYSEHVAEAAPEGRWVTVARAGHSVASEQPEAVNRHLAEHFAGSLASA